MKTLNRFLTLAALAATVPLASAQSTVNEVARGPVSNTAFLSRNATLYGPSGLVVMPTASSVTRYRLVAGTLFTGEDQSLTLNGGIFDGFEAGVTYLDRDRGSDQFMDNAKLRLVPRNIRRLQVGVGVVDAFGAVDQTFYVVGSVDLTPPDLGDRVDAVGARVHLGYGNGLFEDKVMVGGEILFGPRLSLLGDYVAEDISVGVRYAVSDSLRLTGGWSREKLFFGFSSAFNF